MRHIYILSETTLQASHFIYRNGLSPEDYVRITTPAIFAMAPKGARVIKTGRWEKHPDLPELQKLFVDKSSNLLEEKEWLEIVRRNENALN